MSQKPQSGSAFMVVLEGSLCALLTCLAFACLAGGGCNSKRDQAAKAESQLELNEYKNRANLLYDSYLRGDQQEARRSVEDAIQLAQGLKSSPWYQARCLSFYYARLYAIEVRSGNESNAVAALAKVHEWASNEFVLGGHTLAEASAIVKAYTGNRIVEAVDQWDRDHNAGQRAKYTQTIQHE